MLMGMKQDRRPARTIRLRDGVDERLKEEFNVTTDTALAPLLGVDQGQYSRVKSGLAAPGAVFTASLLTAVAPLELDWYDLFEVYPPPRVADCDRVTTALAS